MITLNRHIHEARRTLDVRPLYAVWDAAELTERGDFAMLRATDQRPVILGKSEWNELYAAIREIERLTWEIQ